jgi:short-subunit dehydrogenase
VRDGVNLVLGGTSGLGHAIAVELQQRGDEVFVAGRSYDTEKHGPGAAVDLASEDSVNEFLKTIHGLGNKTLQRFFWVAGYGYKGDFATQPDPQRMADVNYSHVLPIAQSVWRKMLEADQAANFIIVSSTSGHKPRPDEAVYSGTKAAQEQYAKSLGLESERLHSKIKVGLFMPGGMQTEFWAADKPDNFDEFLDPTKVARHIIEQTLAQQAPFYSEPIERGSL